jgi:hypothetical protein
MRCDHCPKQSTLWSWSCFETEICDANEDYGDCEVAKDGNSGMRVFTFFEGVAILFNLLVIERIFIYLMRKTYGINYIVYSLSVLSVIMHIIAFAAWNSIVDPKYEGDCEEFTRNSTDSTEVCALSGPKLAASNIPISLLACALFCVSFFRRDADLDVHKRGIGDDALFCWSYRVWFIALLGGTLLVLALLIGAWATPDWVERNGDDVEFTGSLT